MFSPLSIWHIYDKFERSTQTFTEDNTVTCTLICTSCTQYSSSSSILAEDAGLWNIMAQKSQQQFLFYKNSTTLSLCWWNMTKFLFLSKTQLFILRGSLFLIITLTHFQWLPLISIWFLTAYDILMKYGDVLITKVKIYFS